MGPSLGDVVVDVHANTKGLPGEVRRGTKKIGPEGERAGNDFGHGFNRGFAKNQKRSGGFLRGLLGLPIRTFTKNMAKTRTAIADVFGEISADMPQAIKMGISFKALGVGGAGLARTLLMTAGSMGVLLLAVGPLVSALSMLAGIVTALAGSVFFALVGAVGALGAVIAPAVAGLGVLGLAFIGMSDKAKKTISTAFKPLKKEFQELGKTARGPLIKAIPQMVKNLEGPLRHLKPLVHGISAAMADVGKSFTAGLKTPGFKQFRDAMESFLPGAIRQLGTIARSTLGGIGGIFRAMVPFMQDVLKWLDNLTAGFSRWANSAAGQTAIDAFFMRTKSSLKAVGFFLKEVGGLFLDLFSAGQTTGDSIFTDMGNAIKGWRDALKSDPGILKKWFADSKRFAKALGDIVVALGKVFDALDSTFGRNSAITGVGLLAKGFKILAGAVSIVNNPLQEIKATWSAFKKQMTLDLAWLLEHLASFASWGNKILPGNPFGKWQGQAKAYAQQLRDAAKNMDNLGKKKGGGGGHPELTAIEKQAKDAKDSVKSLWKLLSAGAPKPPKPPKDRGFPGAKDFMSTAALAQMKQLIVYQQKLGTLPVIHPKVDGSDIRKLITDSKTSAENLIRMGLIPPIRPKANPSEILKLHKATGLSYKELAKLGAFKNIKPTADPSQITALMRITGLSKKELIKLGLVKVKPKIKVDSDHAKKVAAAKAALKSIKDRIVHIFFKRSYSGSMHKTVGNRAPGANANSYLGGPLGMAGGGMLPGMSRGDPTIDNLLGLVDNKMPIKLRSGEFIMNEPATKMFMPLLEAMNRAGNRSIGLPSRAAGGPAGPDDLAAGFTMSDKQMRKQAEYFANALSKKGLKLVDRRGNNVQLASLGGN